MPLSPDEQARLEELRTKMDALKLRKLADPTGKDKSKPSTAGFRVAQAEARLAKAKKKLGAVNR